jgi:hypothetical protein
MANLLCPPDLNQINTASGNPSMSHRERVSVLHHILQRIPAMLMNKTS